MQRRPPPPAATSDVRARLAQSAVLKPVRPRGPWRLLGWLLVPSALALGLATLAMTWSAAAPSPRPQAIVRPPPVTATPGGAVSAATARPRITPAQVAVAAGASASPAASPTIPLPASPIPPTVLVAALATLTPRPVDVPSPPATVTSAPAPVPTDSLEGDAPTPSPSGIPLLQPTDSPTAGPSVTPAGDDVSAGPHDPITGLPADPGLLARPPIAVMMDNHPDAAPQTGLNSADMVIEALAEGGITRFEAFFQTGDAPVVGPVRSARPYFVEWAYPFHPLYVHCGGSIQAIDLLNEATNLLTDVDCFNGNMPFWRSADRAMPHNLYSSTTDLWQMAARLGLHAPTAAPGFLHSPPLPPDQRPQSASIGFTFSGLSRSDVSWIYDHDTNRYLRKQWGDWHRDLQTGDIIAASNVVILWTDVWQLSGDEKGRMGTDTTGRDVALILRDGAFEWGSWSRSTVGAPLQFFDGKHQPMRFAPGRIWIEVVGVGKNVEIGH